MKLLSSDQSDEVQVWPSYTDVAMNVILILLFYLFAQVVINSQTSAALLEIRQRQVMLRQTVEQAISAEMRPTITEDGSLQRYTFADRILFDSGKAQLKQSGMDVLDLFGQALRKQVGSFSQIQIEGHTDDLPINVGFPSNWELSSARATSVVRFLQDGAGLDPGLLSATGYSQYHPVDHGNKDDARTHNRRVEVVVVYSVLKPRTEAGPRSTPNR